MEFIRRCDECRRIVHGEAGNACPYCGCAHLNRLEEHAQPCQRMHPPVVKLALAFCVGLVVMQIVAAYLGLNLSNHGHSSPFWHFHLLIGVSTGIYLLLRRIEGDFRALFFVALAIFIFGDGLAALARTYGISALHNLATVFRHALLVFSSLTVTAGAADGPMQSKHERVMLVANCGFMFLSILLLMLEIMRKESNTVQDIASALIALGIAAYAAYALLRGAQDNGSKQVIEPFLKHDE